MIGLVLGSAACLDDDLEEASFLFRADVVIGVNRVGLQYDIDHWASCHIELFPEWVAVRESEKLKPAQLWTNYGNVPHLGPELKGKVHGTAYWEGSSGQLGISVAQTLGCDRIVLCGIPLTDGAEFDGGEFTYARQYRRFWEQNLHTFGNKVRSMSGWTRERLGYPDEEWLHGL